MKQERWAVLILAVLLALGLSGCGEAKRLAGEVLEVRTDEAGALTGFVLERGDGRCFGVEMTEETRAFPPWEGTWYSNEEIRADFQSALQLGCGVSVYYQSRGEAMTSQDGQKLTAYVAQQVNIESTLERGAVTLADGTVVDLRRACTAEGSRNYQLPDGTGLLWVYDGGGPERHYVAGQESLDDSVRRPGRGSRLITRNRVPNTTRWRSWRSPTPRIWSWGRNSRAIRSGGMSVPALPTGGFCTS